MPSAGDDKKKAARRERRPEAPGDGPDRVPTEEPLAVARNPARLAKAAPVLLPARKAVQHPVPSPSPPPSPGPPRRGSLGALVIIVALLGVLWVLVSQGKVAQGRDHCCAADRGAKDSAPAAVWRVAAQMEQLSGGKPILVRELVVGQPAARSAFVAALRRVLPHATFVTLHGSSAEAVVDSLQSVPTDACCVVLVMPEMDTISPEAGGVLKSLFETGAVFGKQLVRTRTAFVGTAESRVVDALPHRVQHMLHVTTL